jgi:hypothetical protein
MNKILITIGVMLAVAGTTYAVINYKKLTLRKKELADVKKTDTTPTSTGRVQNKESQNHIC